MKRCVRCGQDKPDREFTKHSGAADGLRSECKPCRAEHVRERRNARPERHVLTLMIQRCHNPRHPKFKYYGGRGITVCGEWRRRGGFRRFLAHVGPRPTARHEIDRIDNTRGYEPGNVRWATRSQQMRNTRRTIMVTARGKTQSLDAWSAEIGIRKRTLVWRRDQGWSDEDIVGVPLHRRRTA